MWDKYMNMGESTAGENSGQVFESVNSHDINAYKFLPLKGGSYIDLPKDYKNSKKGLLNIINKDDKCFIWCHIAHLYPSTKNKNRVTNYKHLENKVNYKGITFPVLF